VAVILFTISLVVAVTYVRLVMRREADGAMTMGGA
jgi:K+ transporter